jgi:nicotinamide mononucleotide transporter
MGIQEVFHMIAEEIGRTTVPEFIAVAFGMISVVLANRNHVALYPTGIISTTIFIYLFIRAGLYAESLLNGYYLVMSIYGWALWQRHHGSENPRAISINSEADWTITSLIVVLGWILLYVVLKTFTDSTVPVLDALVSCTAWAGMWLLARHKVENWILLNISNLIAIPLLFYKHLPFTALLTLFLFIVAIFGYLRWKKLYIRSLDSHETALK